MKLYLILGLLFSSTVYAQTPDYAAHFRSECEARLDPFSIEVIVPPSQIKYDFSYSIQELTKKKNEKNNSSKWMVIGLTEYELKSKVEWNASILLQSYSVVACSRPSVKIVLDVGPQTVYIAKDFPRNSCAFNAIAEHELRHVRANQEQVEKVGDLLKEGMTNYFKNKIFFGRKEDIKKEVENLISNDWFNWAQQALSAVDFVHAQIDSPEEYAKNNVICNQEIPKAFAKQYRLTN